MSPGSQAPTQLAGARSALGWPHALLPASEGHTAWRRCHLAGAPASERCSVMSLVSQLLSWQETFMSHCVPPRGSLGKQAGICAPAQKLHDAQG